MNREEIKKIIEEIIKEITNKETADKILEGVNIEEEVASYRYDREAYPSNKYDLAAYIIQREKEEAEARFNAILEEIKEEANKTEEEKETEETLEKIEEQGFNLGSFNTMKNGKRTNLTELTTEEIEIIFDTLNDRDILFTKEGQTKAKTTTTRNEREYFITYEITTEEDEERSVLNIRTIGTDLEVIYLEA